MFQEVEAPRFHEIRHKKVVSLSVLHTSRLHPPRKCSFYSFLLEAESIQYHSAAGRIMSMKSKNNTNWNRNRDLPACRTVP